MLEERLKWLDEWDKAIRERDAAEHPKPSPEEQAAACRAELEKLGATLAGGGEEPGFTPAADLPEPPERGPRPRARSR
ncbi:MAG: hypothetical protein U0835_09035 [Isosphaeraceae bacterium]